MIVYGDEYRDMWATVTDSSTPFVKLHFQESEIDLSVPRPLIQNPDTLSVDSTKAQKIRLPVWFLKKQKVIPLF